MSTRLAFLGPKGTYTEQAALYYDPEASLLPCVSVIDVLNAIENTEVDQGVVAIENSIEGSVTQTLDLLIHDSCLFIRHELVVPIQHCLLGQPGTLPGNIEVIYSHPHALAQCRTFLEKHYPKASLMASLSTTSAVQETGKAGSIAAAIANEGAAALYGAEILERRIEDNPNNETRFAVLATSDHSPTGEDKTSLCFDFEGDSPGILYEALLPTTAQFCWHMLIL